MGAAHEILTGLMESFREKLPGVEFRETIGARETMRPVSRAWVTGTVARESTQGDEWSAKLAFQIFLPRNAIPGGAEGVLDAMAGCAEEQPLLLGVERGAAAADKTTGAVAVSCVFSFYKPGTSGGSGSSGGKKVTYPVELDGMACTVTGWKVSESASGSGLTAIGESVPFYYNSRREFTIELQGLSMKGPEKLNGFTLRLGEQKVLYTGCRWKSISAGGSCVAAAGERTEEE